MISGRYLFFASAETVWKIYYVTAPSSSNLPLGSISFILYLKYFFWLRRCGGPAQSALSWPVGVDSIYSLAMFVVCARNHSLFAQSDTCPSKVKSEAPVAQTGLIDDIAQRLVYSSCVYCTWRREWSLSRQPLLLVPAMLLLSVCVRRP